MSECVYLKKKAFAIVNRSGKLQKNDDGSLCLYATKKAAKAYIIPEEEEKIVRVSICVQ